MESCFYNKGDEMNEETMKPGEGITVNAPFPVKNEITFCPQLGEWVMKITQEGIKFNKDLYSDSNTDEFAKAVIDILERDFDVKFTAKSNEFKDHNFYYAGRYFKLEEEFWAYVNEFTECQMNRESFYNLFDMVKKDIWINLTLRQTEITNGQLRSILEEVFLSTLERFSEFRSQKMKPNRLPTDEKKDYDLLQKELGETL